MNPQYGKNYKNNSFNWDFFYKNILRFCEREIIRYRKPFNFNVNKKFILIKKIFRKLIK